MRPKQVTTRAWQHTRPLASGDVGETMFGRGVTCNPALVLRPSGLIGLEGDSEEDLAAIHALGLPDTITVRSSQLDKQHRWYRPPASGDGAVRRFRFEHGVVSADEHRYLLCPPAIHPSRRRVLVPARARPRRDRDRRAPRRRLRRMRAAGAGEQREAARSRPRVDPAAKVAVRRPPRRDLQVRVLAASLDDSPRTRSCGWRSSTTASNAIRR